MRVGFDAGIFHAARTGIGYYTFFLLAHLREQAGLELLAYNGLSMRPLDAAFFAPSEPGADAAGGGLGAAVAARLRRLDSVRSLYRALKAANFRRAARGLDLFHATNYLPPARADVPTLPLIHDVSHLRHPEWHPAERVAYLEKRAGEFTAAPLVNTVSAFSAREIEATLGIPLSRLRVTHPGTNPLYAGEPEDAAAHLAALDVEPGRFFLCVGTLEPRKNLATAILAYDRLAEPFQARFPLLVAGPQGWGDLALPAAAERLARAGRLRFLGYVAEARMHALYHGAAAFLFPSSYEGFGMPVSEAMAAGARPLVAEGGAPDEVAGGLGVTLPAFAPEDWTAALERAAAEGWHADAGRRAALRRRGASFSWAANAAATRLVYDELLKTGSCR